MKRILILSFAFTAFISLLPGCSSPTPVPTSVPLSGKTNAELIQLLEKFGDPNFGSSEYTAHLIVEELGRRGSSASEAAPALARAMAYNQRDSYLASSALTAMGPSAKSAIPYLLQNLDNNREEVRRHSIFVLGLMGEPASCTVPKIASLLWDKEPYVRSISAAALTRITAQDLVEYDDLKLDPDLPGNANPDKPEGKITKLAREWWLSTGQSLSWPTENCEMSKQSKMTYVRRCSSRSVMRDIIYE